MLVISLMFTSYISLFQQTHSSYQVLWSDGMEDPNLWSTKHDVDIAYYSSNCPYGDSNPCTRLRTDPEDGIITRTTDISSSNSGFQLQFDVKMYSLQDQDFCAVDYKYNTDSYWSVIYSNNTDATHFNIVVDIPPPTTSANSLSIRLKIHGNIDNDERCYFDNVILRREYQDTPQPTSSPTSKPTSAPTPNPTAKPTSSPTAKPTSAPTSNPTAKPTSLSTSNPTSAPIKKPTSNPTTKPTPAPTTKPTSAPTSNPTAKSTSSPASKPTSAPTSNPTMKPILKPTSTPTSFPIATPTTDSPTKVVVATCPPLDPNDPCSSDYEDCCPVDNGLCHWNPSEFCRNQGGEGCCEPDTTTTTTTTTTGTTASSAEPTTSTHVSITSTTRLTTRKPTMTPTDSPIAAPSLSSIDLKDRLQHGLQKKDDSLIWMYLIIAVIFIILCCCVVVAVILYVFCGKRNKKRAEKNVDFREHAVARVSDDSEPEDYVDTVTHDRAFFNTEGKESNSKALDMLIGESGNNETRM